MRLKYNAEYMSFRAVVKGSLSAGQHQGCGVPPPRSSQRLTPGTPSPPAMADGGNAFVMP
jgi:hypothetical protein